jgi:hypothetical protein
MRNAIIIATAVSALAASSVVYAQQTLPRSDRPERAERTERWRPSAQDRSALTDARLAALKAGLRLTPEQEKSWPAVEQALRDLAQQREQRWEERREGRRGAERADLIERMRQTSERMSERADALKKLADAAQPLYQSLDEGQKRRLDVLLRTMRPHARGFARWRHERGSDGRQQ